LKSALDDDGVSLISCPVDYTENLRLIDRLGQLDEALSSEHPSACFQSVPGTSGIHSSCFVHSWLNRRKRGRQMSDQCQTSPK
jgi:hypothetical protein